MLNACGYGIDPHLPLDLVYNPVEATLPPDQSELEADYKCELEERFGIQWSFTVSDVPQGADLPVVAYWSSKPSTFLRLFWPSDALAFCTCYSYTPHRLILRLSSGQQSLIM